MMPDNTPADRLQQAPPEPLASQKFSLQTLLIVVAGFGVLFGVLTWLGLHGTGAIIDRLARQDRRIRPIHIEVLPQGWLGKVHALHRGVQQAKGEWILFCDADVHFSPNLLKRSIAYALGHNLDHLTLIPKLQHKGFWLDVAVRSFGLLFLLSARAGSVSKPIYSIVSSTYGTNESLGSITFAEDGRITTEIKNESMLSIRYKTKYHVWRVTSTNVKDVQCVLDWV